MSGQQPVLPQSVTIVSVLSASHKSAVSTDIMPAKARARAASRASFFIAASLWYDCYLAEGRDSTLWRRTRFGSRFRHPKSRRLRAKTCDRSVMVPSWAGRALFGVTKRSFWDLCTAIRTCALQQSGSRWPFFKGLRHVRIRAFVSARLHRIARVSVRERDANYRHRPTARGKRRAYPRLYLSRMPPWDADHCLGCRRVRAPVLS